MKLSVPKWHERDGEAAYEFLFEDALHHKHWTAEFRYK